MVHATMVLKGGSPLADLIEARCRKTVSFCLIESRNSVAIRGLKSTQLQGIPMLWTIIIILVVLWLLGFIGHFGGALIHLLLVIAVVILIINLIQGRRGL